MFYQCPKCKKTWQYPIEKCPDCFLELKKVLTKKIKVIGISKVTIPTLLHPRVPYFVLVLEDENKNRWVQKTFKEYKIGDEFKIKIKKDKNTVAIWRIKYDILEAIEKTIYLIGGIRVNQNSKILILPTLISPKHPYFAVNTNPGTLRSLVQFLLSKGVKKENIKVGAQSFNEFPIEASASKSKLLSVCSENKITPLDLAKTNFIKKEKDKFNFEISSEVFNNDLIINLPILKLDSKLGVRAALENTMKLLKKESYLALKYLYSEEKVMKKLQAILPEYLTVGDGLVIRKTNDYTAFLGIVLASFNPLNLDRVFAEIAMIKNLPGHLKEIKIGDIPIAGREIKEVQYDIEGIGT